jgi:hypothetical protein
VISSLDLGSHILIVGEVQESDITSDEEPLTYAWYREKYKMLSPKNSPTYIDKKQLEQEEEAEKQHEPVSVEATARRGKYGYIYLHSLRISVQSRRRRSHCGYPSRHSFCGPA